MSLEDGQKLYMLKKPLTYRVKGETKKAQFLELREPGMSHSRGYLKIKQMVTGLMMSSAKAFDGMGLDRDDIISGTQVKKLHEVDAKKHEEESDQLAEMISYCFGLSSEISLANFVEEFEKIACRSAQKSICVVDGETPMSPAIWEDLHPEDAEGAALKWAAFFTMPSDLKEAKGSGNASESLIQAKEL